ncbi:MAG: sulfatase-like hydrolase/transferase [Planctomycetota bacterium]
MNWGTGLKIAETNIAKALQDAGYFTGVVGKWHLGHDISRYSTEMKTLDPMKPEDNQRIIDAHAGTCAAFKEAGFDFADSIYVGNVGEIHVPQMLKRENLPWVTQGAFNFLDLQSPDSDKPFFLYMSLPLPHNQYYDTQNRSGKGAGWWNNDPRATPGGYLDGAPTSQPSSEDVMRRVRAAGLPDVNSMATRIDDCLGAIMAKLDERGLTENTVLIFTSDHQSRGKNTVYEAGRVPFVVRWPGKIPAGVRSDLLSGNVDLPPTFLEWAGAENVPEDMGQDGVSLAQALLNPEDAKPVRDALLLECGYARGVVTDRWKLIACRATDEIEQRMAEDAARAEREGTRRYVGWDGRTNKQFLGRRGFSAGVIMDSDRDFPHYFDADQLYDLDADPFEQVNLFEDEANRKTIEQLQTQLRGFLKTLPHTFGEFTD